MSRDCQYSKKTIDVCYENALRYENDLRGEMFKGVPNDMDSLNNEIHLKGLDQLISRLNDMKQFTNNFLEKAQMSRDTVSCREPKGRSGAPQQTDDSGVHSINDEALVSQSTDSHHCVKPDEGAVSYARQEKDDDELNPTINERPMNIQPTNGATNHTQ